MSEQDYSDSNHQGRAMDASGLKSPATVPAARGIAWVREGMGLWRSAPLNLTAMGILATVLFVAVQMVPMVGALAALLFWPHLSAGLYLAYRHALEEKPVVLTDLFRPYRQPGPLLMLGGAYLALSVAVMVLVFAHMASVVGAEQLQAWMVPQEGGFDPQTLEQVLTQLMWPMLLAVLLTLLLLMAFAFAPLLVHQHSKSAYRAIALSFTACIKALPAFMLWGLCWFVIFMLVNLLALVPLAGPVLITVFMLSVVTFMTGSLYAAYLDLFIRD
ncbi:MAG: BPSS1780 family membrane protein [Oleiphilaceae bacterium]|nr:BPSS1780 family membrane protein [Oleiphilaceae bacterium]